VSGASAAAGSEVTSSRYVSRSRPALGQTEGVSFPTSSPSRQGVDPAGLVGFVDALDTDPAIEPHGLIVHRHGHRVLETYWSPHRAGQPRLGYSLSKTFTGTALGLAVGDGLLSLEDRVIDHLPELADHADERMGSMRIRHLASMSTGHADETLLDALMTDPTDLVAAFVKLPPQNDPGTWFAYNQPPVLVLSAILQRLTGQRLVDQLRGRVLDQIGVGDLRWSQYKPGIDLGFSGVFTDLDAIARLGQLHLDSGRWNGEQVLPLGWVEEASSIQIENAHRPEPDWALGYGIQMWMCRHGFRGDGAFGQFMVVLPQHRAVVAFHSCTEDMQVVMDHIWDSLLPAFTDVDADEGSVDPEGDAAVTARATGLHVPTAADRIGAQRPLDTVTDANFTRSPGFPSHPSISSIQTSPGEMTITEGDQTLAVTLTDNWSDVPGHPLSTSAAVGEDGRIHVDVATLSSPHRLEIIADPTRSTFTATWPLPPLFGFGFDGYLTKMHPPEN
jgi:CubicO group peptidase (beta-lactamase class C family)